MRVQPDDWLRSDSDGLVVIPARQLTQVLVVGEEAHQAEERIRSAIDVGDPMRQARATAFIAYYTPAHLTKVVT